MSDKRKYTDDEYAATPYWQDDDDETSHSEQKVLTVRKEQTCMSIFSDPHPIPSGTRAVRETAIHVDKGRVSCYMCLDCADYYIAEMLDE